MRVTSIDTDHGKIDTPKLVPKPTCHCSGLEPDALGMGRALAKQFSQGARVGLHRSLVDGPSYMVDHAHRRFPLRYVQPDILLHVSPP
jgi:hypothetical protein